MSKLQINDSIKKFSAKYTIDGIEREFNNSSITNSWSVIYFYPKDLTTGCTAEACEFRDSYKFFIDNKINLFAVSKDPIKSHIKFSDKYSLPFILISDETLSVVNAFDVYSEKSMYGKKYMGVDRSTFIINPEGKIAFKWDKVKPVGHASEVIEQIKLLM
jgi:thioredoxin-dependent peroxiredoxin